jgi:hypothetical protein
MTELNNQRNSADLAVQIENLKNEMQVSGLLELIRRWQPLRRAAKPIRSKQETSPKKSALLLIKL